MRNFFVVFCLLILSNLVYSATLHGSVYDNSYNLLKDVQIEINTTPKQSHISKNGVYFFYIPLGTYEITAERYIQKQLAYTTTEIVEVSRDGEFNIDIVLEQIPGVNIIDDGVTGPSFLAILEVKYPWLLYGGGVVILLILLLAGYFLFFKRNKIIKPLINMAESIQATVLYHDSEPELDIEGKVDDDNDNITLDSVLRIIKEEGGRATQRDIRKKMPLSEAKVSLMISELESSGKIQKIKKGRGNILVLK